MNITFLGHAGFHIEINGVNIVIDPFITGNPQASNINVNDLKADYIFLTHAHQDHILDAETIAKRSGAIIVSNYEIAMHYKEKGFKGYPLNHGGTFKTNLFTAKYVNAVHTSSFPDGTYGGQPGGFVISSKEKSLYVAGDTAVTMDMKLIPMTTKLTASIFPIGDTFTMGVEDAIIASDLVECNKVIACHYNTFPPIEIDTEKAKQQFSNAKKELILLEIGASVNI